MDNYQNIMQETLNICQTKLIQLEKENQELNKQIEQKKN